MRCRNLLFVLVALSAFALGLGLLEPTEVEAATVSMVCEGLYCESQVNGSTAGGYTNHWSGSGGAYPAQQSTGPFMLFGCFGDSSPIPARAHVTVYNGGTLVGSASRTLGCGSPF